MGARCARIIMLLSDVIKNFFAPARRAPKVHFLGGCSGKPNRLLEPLLVCHLQRFFARAQPLLGPENSSLLLLLQVGSLARVYIAPAGTPTGAGGGRRRCLSLCLFEPGGSNVGLEPARPAPRICRQSRLEWLMLTGLLGRSLEGGACARFRHGLAGQTSLKAR